MLSYRRRGAPSEPVSPPAMQSRRILLAAYHFPPSAAVGGLRISRFARFLPEFGWQPYVLTVDDADRPQDEGTDHGRLVGLESVPITRTHQPSGIFDFYARIKRKLLHFRGGHARHGPAVETPVRPDGSEGLVQRLKRYARSLFVLLPDEQKNWSVFAAIPAVRLIRRHGIDCILTSAPPFSVHLVGLVAQSFTRVSWVADFRDPWGESLAYRSAHSQSWLSRQLEQRMEAMVMNHADRVLTTTEQMRQSVMARYPHIDRKKFSCLPNGFDFGHLALPDRSEKFDRLTITYAGTLYLDRTPEPLFAALGALVKEGKARIDDVCIKLVGHCRYVGDVETEALARRHGVESAVEFVDRLPHTEAARLMQRSHLLLVLAPGNHHLILPAKIFDYLGSGSKLLALAAPGPTADLIRETGGGTCFYPNDVSGLKAYLHDLLTSRAYLHLRNNPELYRRWDGRTLTGQLAAMLPGSARSDGQVVEMSGTARSRTDQSFCPASCDSAERGLTGQP